MIEPTNRGGQWPEMVCRTLNGANINIVKQVRTNSCDATYERQGKLSHDVPRTCYWWFGDFKQWKDLVRGCMKFWCRPNPLCFMLGAVGRFEAPVGLDILCQIQRLLFLTADRWSRATGWVKAAARMRSARGMTLIDSCPRAVPYHWSFMIIGASYIVNTC